MRHSEVTMKSMSMNVSTTAAQDAIDEGRAMQFEEMMAQLASMQAKYKGVRGELLEKVRAELMQLKPTTGATASPPRPVRAVPSPAPQNVLPSCRVCGRGMKLNAADSTLVCERGHTRFLT
jgi:hypothetical protein